MLRSELSAGSLGKNHNTEEHVCVLRKKEEEVSVSAKSYYLLPNIKIKLIKTCLKSSMAQDHLSAFAIFTINTMTIPCGGASECYIGVISASYENMTEHKPCV